MLMILCLDIRLCFVMSYDVSCVLHGVYHCYVFLIKSLIISSISNLSILFNANHVILYNTLALFSLRFTIPILPSIFEIKPTRLVDTQIQP